MILLRKMTEDSVSKRGSFVQVFRLKLLRQVEKKIVERFLANSLQSTTRYQRKYSTHEFPHFHSVLRNLLKSPFSYMFT